MPTLNAPLTGQALYQKARTLIPGASQLLGKRAEMYLPELWPAYYSKAKGCEIWDLEGKKYLDFTMVGIGTSVLGYADPDVERAVIAAVQSGNMTTLNCPEDVELAELLCELHPWADMATYARTGGEMMAKAIRIARAATGRDKIAFCGYHGWHDWYLAVNLSGSDKLNGHLLPGLEPRGVPAALANTLLPFAFNDVAELERIVSEHGDSLAAICMEPVRSSKPTHEFLNTVRTLSKKSGAVLIFDEITAGFRLATGGVHLTLGVQPDMAVFAKTMSNGFPMAAVIGRREVMDATQSTFISSAYWTERIGPSAALASIRRHKAIDAPKTLDAIGARVQEGWKGAAERQGLRISVSGITPLSAFSLEHEDSAALMTLFIQEMLDKGYLASDRFYPTVCHEPHVVEAYLRDVEDTFSVLKQAIQANDVRQRLRGPVKHTGFKRLA